MGRSISAPVIRFVIGANRIIGANPQALQGTVEDMRKSGSSRDEAPKRALGAGACRIINMPHRSKSPPPREPERA